MAGPGYPELQEAFERRYVQDGNLRSYSGAVFANTLPPKPIRAPLVLKGPWFRYNDRFFQTPNTFLTQTLSIGHGDEHFRLVTERRYLKSDTLIVIGTSVNNMRHIDDDVKSGQVDLMLEPSAGFLLARANRDERRAMRGPVVRAYDVEVMRDLLA